MSALINALDNHTQKQTGENGHAEYGWSNSIKERILQFSFQVTRTDEKGLNKLEKILDGILNELVSKQKEIIDLLVILYKMIGHTRDIIDGKGECMITYMMIYTWYHFYPQLAIHALKCLVDYGDNGVTHQYGSWKDIKYFCNYCLSKKCPMDHPLIVSAISIMNDQLRADYERISTGSNTFSLVARWVPREKSKKFGGKLYEAFACQYFSRYIETTNWVNEDKKQKSTASAILKCKTEYRKLLSTLNKKIDTLQIKQCGKTWSEIEFTKVTSISLSKQRKAFLNVTKKGETRCPDNEDRIACAEHFNEHIEKAVKGETEMKGKRVAMSDFTKQAIELLASRNNSTQTEMNLLNSQWRDNSSQTGALGKMIAMVDVSGSMSGDPLNVAIALGIRVAEKSLLGKRVMTFSSTPKWVNLDGVDTFTSMVKIVQTADWGMSTNFMSALSLILDAIVASKLPPSEVEDMVLAIFSDMQIDQGDHSGNNTTMYDAIKEKYALAGLKLFGQPFTPPHILFWNLRSTSGFPTLSNQPNASMMSGFSPALLNLFCDQGLEALQSATPWGLLEKSLDNARYSILESKARETF